MCCIAVCEAVRLTVEDLEAMTVTNKDGIGFAWRGSRKTEWVKGVDMKQAQALARGLPLPYVCHTRQATIGMACNGLAHPFPIEKMPRLRLQGAAHSVLFHNGHVSEWRLMLRLVGLKVRKVELDLWSDSRAIAHVVAMRGEDILAELTPSRFAVFNSSGIRLYGDWKEEKGVRYSTLPWRTSYTSYSYDELYKDYLKRQEAKKEAEAGITAMVVDKAGEESWPGNAHDYNGF